MRYTILIADDEQEIVELLTLYAENAGIRVVGACTGREALERIREGEIDLALLDIMMPEIDGYHLVQEIRTQFNIPVIFLSAKTNDHDKILGLGLGADDYISKPFNPLEVIARVRAQLRRYYDLNTPKEMEQPQNVIAIGGLRIDKDSCSAYREEELLDLTSMEYKLLLFFMENAGRVVTKHQIYEKVWGDVFVDDNTITVHICKLRDKLEDDLKRPTYLRTIRGLGYKFEKKVNLHET